MPCAEKAHPLTRMSEGVFRDVCDGRSMDDELQEHLSATTLKRYGMFPFRLEFLPVFRDTRLF